MKAKNFRIGNFLEDREGRLCIVKGIDIIEDKEHQISAPAITGGITALPVKPLKITDKYLKRLGFKENGQNLLYLPIPHIKSEMHYEKKAYGNVITLQSSVGMFIPNDINYIHEVQNLFFAITGTELELKHEPRTFG